MVGQAVLCDSVRSCSMKCYSLFRIKTSLTGSLSAEQCVFSVRLDQRVKEAKNPGVRKGWRKGQATSSILDS